MGIKLEINRLCGGRQKSPESFNLKITRIEIKLYEWFIINDNNPRLILTVSRLVENRNYTIIRASVFHYSKIFVAIAVNFNLFVYTTIRLGEFFPISVQLQFKKKKEKNWIGDEGILKENLYIYIYINSRVEERKEIWLLPLYYKPVTVRFIIRSEMS